MRLKVEKKTTTSKYLYFWSYCPISSYLWELPPFMATFLDHNLWTTYLNFMFLSIFRNVFKVLNPSKSSKQRSTTQHFYIFGKISYFWTLMRNRPKLWSRNRSKPLRSNIARQTCIGVAFFVFCRSNMPRLKGGKLKNLKKNTSRSLLDHSKYGLLFSL